MKIEKGDTVNFHYTGKFEDGEVFDTSDEAAAKEAGVHNPERGYDPLAVKIGEGQIIKGLDEALVGMEKGEEKKVTIPPAEAYGEKRPELVQEVPKDAFAQSGIEPKEGMMVGTSNGAARITGVKEDTVEMDFNHPLAGRTLVFEVKIESVERA